MKKSNATKKYFISLFVVFFVTFLQACGEGSEGIVGTGLEITGAAQKGPFVRGSNILVNKLSPAGEATNKTIVTETKDDLGNFSFTLEEPSLVQIVATGYHFNELTGSLSNSLLTLRAIYSANNSDNQKSYVNVMTHLIQPRIIVLIKSGMLPSDAIMQAQVELIEALQTVFPVNPQFSAFTDLNLFNLDDNNNIGNAYLLALSASLYQLSTNNSSNEENIEAELTSILNNLADVLAQEGTIDNEIIVSDLALASQELKPRDIEANLRQRSLSILDKSLVVPNMDLVLDSDGDGVVNKDDKDSNGDGFLDEKTDELFTRVLSEKYTFYETIQTRDGGYIAAGKALKENDSEKPTNDKPLLLKLNEFGEQTWTKEIDFLDSYVVSQIKETEDGNFILLGFSASNEPSHTGPKINISGYYYSLHIFKVSENDILWAKHYHDIFPGKAKLQETSDGLIVNIISYDSNFTGISRQSPLLINIDTDGNIQWEFKFDKTIENFVSLTSVLEGSDGNFTLVGTIHESESFPSREEAIKNGYTNDEIDWELPTTASKNFVFTSNLSSDATEFTYNKLEIKSSPFRENYGVLLSDQSLIIFSDNNNGPNNLFKLDKSSNILWEKRFDNLYSSPGPLLMRNQLAFVGKSSDLANLELILLDTDGELVDEPNVIFNATEFNNKLAANPIAVGNNRKINKIDSSSSHLFSFSKTEDDGFLLLGQLDSDEWALQDTKWIALEDAVTLPFIIRGNADGITVP